MPGSSITPKIHPMKCLFSHYFNRFILVILCMQTFNLHAQSNIGWGPTSARYFLSASDIHFNPFFDPSLMSKLINADYTGWEAIFESSAIQQPNGYGSDANYPLLKSALRAMQQQNSAPSFIIISGDFLCHDFQANYSKYADSGSVQTFTAKTIQFLAWMLNKYFPQTVVLPVLGNNDSYCGDYMVEPNSPFLLMFARAWAPLLRNKNKAADSIFVAQFSKGGYYTHPFPGKVRGNLILLNTVFFSAKYYNACGNTRDDPGSDELQWLKEMLEDNHLRNEVVWMVYHIPPGVDVHATLHNYGDCQSNITLMWRDNYNNRFLDLIQQFSSLVRTNLAGHTHMDDFRVIYQNKLPISFIHITPAISPRFANNPGFQLISYHHRLLQLMNAKTFYLSINKNANTWTPEYNFQLTYNVAGINASSLNWVRNKIAADSAYLNKYINLYKVSNPGSNEINLQNWKAFWCGNGALTQQQFSDCYCQ